MADVILFDIDGTLVDSTYHHAFAWQRSFARLGMTVPFWRLHRTIGMGGDKLVGEVAGDDVEKEHGDALRDGWAEEYRKLVEEVRPLPGAVELVREVADAGLVVALASSGETEFSEKAVEMLGIGELVHTMTSSPDADESKPDADILTATLDRVPGGRAVLLGDTPYDVEAAGRIGLACLCVLSGGFGREELEAAGAALVVDDLAELAGTDWTKHLRDPQR
jgi:phosphoglycolate phosphatase-like HAD superfamily hydrolase